MKRSIGLEPGNNMIFRFLMVLMFTGSFFLSAGQRVLAAADRTSLLGGKPGAGPGDERILEPKTLDRFYDPIEFRAEILGELRGTGISLLRLYSLLDGSFQQVRFQFDEWSEDGYMILDQGPEANTDLANGLLDPQDMLVFMARDSGDRVSPSLWPERADKGIEIEITDPLTAGKGWLYLLRFPESAPEIPFSPPASKGADGAFLADGGSYGIVGTDRMINNIHYKTIVNKHIWVTPGAGGDGKDFIDRSRIRLSASLMFGMIRVGFNEDDFIGGVDKNRVGLVRGIGRQWIRLKMPMGMKPPKMYADVYGYDTMVFIVSRIDLPFNPKHFLTDFKTIQGYDLHHPHGYGMRWYNSNNPEGFLADGVMSPEEHRLDSSPDRWRCIIGANGWMIHRALWDKDYYEQAEITVKYNDDLEERDPPDYYPGNLGYYFVETKLKSLEPREYKYQMDWYWPYDFYDPSGLRMDIVQSMVDIRDHPLEIRVGSQRAKNQGAYASIVEP